MQVSVSPDTASASSDGAPSLRLEVLDALMAAKGIRSTSDQARAFGINITHWFEVRSGRHANVTLKTALKIASVAGATVDELWERTP